MGEEDIKKRWEEYIELLRSTKREGIENFIKWLDQTDFKIAPASTKYHLNCKGGLLEHTLNVYHSLKDDFKVFIDLFKIPEDTVIITALLHDICKANIYTTEMRNTKVNGEWIQEPFYKKEDLFPLGHGEKSVIIAQKYIELTALEVLMIRWHMGYSDRPPYDVPISDAYTRFPQIMILNWADEVATFMIESNFEGRDKYSLNGFNDLFKGRSTLESLEISKKPQVIEIDGCKYEVAPKDAIVDNNEVILINYQGNQVKVYAPYGDGLPF